MRKRKTVMSKRTKGILSAVAIILIVAIGAFLYFKQNNRKTSATEKNYKVVNVTEGTISSSTLLSGTVKALSEEYIYFDQSKGTTANVIVNVGDQVTEGQQLVQYDATAAQASYDTAIRNLNKVGRQIQYLKTYGVQMPQTEQSPETGSDGNNPAVQATQSASNFSQNTTYSQQLQDLNDAYANAQSEVNKAQQQLNQTVVSSKVSGTVVEVNNDVDPSSKNSQTLVHVATEGQLQVKCTLTEFDLANIKKDQEVKIKSKVYSDQEWTGKISYISNYPNQSGSENTGNNSQGSGNTTSSNYDYKVDITSPLNELKQGFSVTVEVINSTKHQIVPVSSVERSHHKAYVWVYDNATSKIKKREVILGNADAKKQEILSGLQIGNIVVANPDKSLKEDRKLKNVISNVIRKENKKSEDNQRDGK